MKVDIWSDVRCPFCYIGKHKFETALAQFAHKENIAVEWHSFELDRSLQTNPTVHPVEHLATTKGIGVDQMKEMMHHAAKAAEEVGIKMNFENGVVANSFNAHRLIQYAKTKGVANEIEEKLFEAHFVNGENIDDASILIEIGEKCGLEGKSLTQMLSSEEFSQEVKADEVRAEQLGIRGVPFFVFDNKYAVSGAQAPEHFLQALTQSWEEFAVQEKPTLFREGPSCDTAGNCD